MLGWLDLVAVFVVCVTVVICFLVRSGHGTDVEELAEQLESFGDIKAKYENLEKTVTANAITLKRVVDAKTNAAVEASFRGRG